MASDSRLPAGNAPDQPDETGPIVAGGDGERSGMTRRNPHAARLRAAGLRVTSARIATLQAAPALIATHGYLTPALLREACVELGYAVHLSVFYHLLPDLAAVGLVPVDALRLPESRLAGLPGRKSAACLPA